MIINTAKYKIIIQMFNALFIFKWEIMGHYHMIYLINFIARNKEVYV